eukprot:scpid75074/ scgid22119/ 
MFGMYQANFITAKALSKLAKCGRKRTRVILTTIPHQLRRTDNMAHILPNAKSHREHEQCLSRPQLGKTAHTLPAAIVNRISNLAEEQRVLFKLPQRENPAARLGTSPTPCSCSTRSDQHRWRPSRQRRSPAIPSERSDAAG